MSAIDPKRTFPTVPKSQTVPRITLANSALSASSPLVGKAEKTAARQGGHTRVYIVSALETLRHSEAVTDCDSSGEQRKRNGESSRYRICRSFGAGRWQGRRHRCGSFAGRHICQERTNRPLGH
jgi:hypothetical protein